MGSRITRAATHLSEKAVQERMQREQRLWCRQRWEIIYQALTAPRKAEDIARTVGVSVSTVHRVIAAYKREGVAGIETAGKGGRHHQYLTLEQEHAFLQPFVARVAQAEMVTVVQIKLAYEEVIKQRVSSTTIYRLLGRHGWRLRSTSSRTDLVPLSPQRAQEDAVPLRQRKQQAFPKSGQRERTPQRSQSYPSDLSDEEWAILEPLIPAAKPGGRPRSVDMREVINAICYVDRTGCQWRALPHDFPCWSTVWSYFRTFRK